MFEAWFPPQSHVFVSQAGGLTLGASVSKRGGPGGGEGREMLPSLLLEKEGAGDEEKRKVRCRTERKEKRKGKGKEKEKAEKTEIR